MTRKRGFMTKLLTSLILPLAAWHSPAKPQAAGGLARWLIDTPFDGNRDLLRLGIAAGRGYANDLGALLLGCHLPGDDAAFGASTWRQHRLSLLPFWHLQSFRQLDGSLFPRFGLANLGGHRETVAINGEITTGA